MVSNQHTWKRLSYYFKSCFSGKIRQSLGFYSSHFVSSFLFPGCFNHVCLQRHRFRSWPNVWSTKQDLTWANLSPENSSHETRLFDQLGLAFCRSDWWNNKSKHGSKEETLWAGLALWLDWRFDANGLKFFALKKFYQMTYLNRYFSSYRGCWPSSYKARRFWKTQ